MMGSCRVVFGSSGRWARAQGSGSRWYISEWAGGDGRTSMSELGGVSELSNDTEVHRRNGLER
jgi:hypothetical protein